MKFKTLAEYFDRIEKISSRLSMTEILSDLFKKIGKEEIDKVLYLLQGRVSPLYVRQDFGIAEKMLIRAIVESLKIEKKHFIYEYKRQGDLGKTLEKFKKEKRSADKKDISIKKVFTDLDKLTTTGGVGSQEAKLKILSNLIEELDPLSARFLVRIPTNTLRLGFSDMTILDAFSWMLKGDKSLRGEIEKAYHVRPDLGFIGKTLKIVGIRGLKKVEPAVFTPIIMMRAERVSDPSELLEKTGGHALVESKYDGFRLQVHYKKMSNVKGQMLSVKLYSRNLDDVSFMYPDIVEGVEKQVKAREIIFEGEAIGYEPASGSFLPFQETVQRKRKYGIAEKIKEIPLKFFAFDVLFYNAKNLLRTAFADRRKILIQALVGGKDKDNIIVAAENKEVNKERDIDLLFDDAISRGLEGIVVKKTDGIYQPGARGFNWIKYKRSYSSKIEDTIDCLVMGYDLGLGKRTGFGMGAFLVGIYDEKKDKFKTVAKIGTGLSDQEWRELKKRCGKVKTDKIPALYDVDKMMDVDVWVKPSIVVEIRADELTKSPVHTAGRTMKKTKTGKAVEVDNPGFALRFPRLEKFRDDKRPEEVTTLSEVEKMYKKQKK